MAQDSGENRKFKRYEVDSVHGKMTYLSDINILNISMDGAAIATTQRLSIDREYALKLNYENHSLTLRGKVVWSVLSQSKTLKNGEVWPVYKVGLKFTNVLTDEATDLIAYIEKNKTGDREKRILGVRFKVCLPHQAAINMPCEYYIKKISLGGMLIAADAAHEIDSEHEMDIYLDGAPITIVGRIVHVAETKVEGAVKYDIGIEFINMRDEDRKILISYIEAMEKRT
jgi:c-di-GMP-binding flagellar brake protein YcgR